ncbi:hypothetical protein NC653_002326 [Populus alba x Populus x berolinensis]|uniref:Serine hydroxymethyltransferase-like domain-containing protein n=1 Tax=Populus alba x Populus x berolinensis TaxID=444605 RepID=A0AAD6RND7_9ROSI|nr:hypothetical protein NC653_002326 [Populus alba x Populus x berolinensis]
MCSRIRVLRLISLCILGCCCRGIGLWGWTHHLEGIRVMAIIPLMGGRFPVHLFSSRVCLIRSNPQTGYIDFDKLEERALDFRPKILICGGSSYPREWGYARLRHIADKCGAVLMCDMAQISGLVAAKVHITILLFCLSIPALMDLNPSLNRALAVLAQNQKIGLELIVVILCKFCHLYGVFVPWGHDNKVC